jgi:uncharacterized protein (DUF1330 family)
MKLRNAFAMAILSSIAAGAAVHTLHAQAGPQAKPPAYLVAINDIFNPEGYLRDYLPTAQKILKDHGGVIVASAPGTPIDGSFPKGRVVILKFDSMDALLGWRHSPEYEKIRKVGEAYGNYNLIAVEGPKQ